MLIERASGTSVHWPRDAQKDPPNLTPCLLLQAFTSYNSTVDQNLNNQVVYRIWLVAQDALGNNQTALSSVTVKTVRTTPPVFQELLVEYNAPSSVYVEVIFAACIIQLLAKPQLRLYDICCSIKQQGTSCWVWHKKSAPTASMGHMLDLYVLSCTAPSCVAYVSRSASIPEFTQWLHTCL